MASNCSVTQAASIWRSVWSMIWSRVVGAVAAAWVMGCHLLTGNVLDAGSGVDDLVVLRGVDGDWIGMVPLAVDGVVAAILAAIVTLTRVP